MAKINREFTPAVVKEVTPAQEVFHLELSPEEMALIYLLVGNSYGSGDGRAALYMTLKQAMNFRLGTHQLCLLDSRETIGINAPDIQRVLLKRQK